MLESTFFVTRSSFFGVFGVVDQFGQLHVPGHTRTQAPYRLRTAEGLRLRQGQMIEGMSEDTSRRMYARKKGEL